MRTLQVPHVESSTACKIAGPWPTYASFRNLPERERWVLYGSAKAYRQALEDQGFVMAESYDAFIKRVTDEMEL
ncbi:phage-like protein [Pseudomonas fluorescens NCIMB 11764]|jgi:hypothetical protein|uniref:Phage-like protein n=1 Tax=Pseudomonas fluorescens NCIMB 11764 TaxID=1221522 RepID=A0A0K1QQ62_PSEFL|nr:hypothetical protein [Pseudomonas fluorescens]AKV07899.1 phage-like protein [Pseudomonas fluorescens NCIMB 11764]